MRHKLQPVSRPGIFVGYERGSDAYRVQMPDGKVEVSANVTFDESPSGAAAAAAAASGPDFDYTRVAFAGEPVGETRTEDAGTAGTDAVGDAPAGTDAAPAGEEKPTPAAAPEPRRSPRFQVAVVAADVQIPASYKEALASPQSDEWVRAMEEELASLHEKQTWTLVPLPKGAKAIPTKWVYDVKCDASGQIERFKARLVAKGFKQRAGIDFDEVFAPASNPTTTRLLLAMVAAKRMVLRQVDVKTAFLNGELEETIYVTQPQGFEQGEFVCELSKALYGLKQASRAWHTLLKSTLEEQGFKASAADPTLFVRTSPTGPMYVVVHVDDFLIAGENDAEVRILASLKGKFEMRELDGATYFLGIEIAYDRGKGELRMSQRKYAMEVLERFEMADCNPRVVPMAPSAVLRRAGEKEEPFDEASRFRELIGALMYLAVYTRPDIAQGVYRLARYMAKPTKAHWEHAKGILRYLRGTCDLGLVFGGDGKPVVTAFSDSDWAGDLDTRRSTTGFVFVFNGAAVSWRSRLQPTVAASSVEAEYMAASSATREALWLEQLLAEFGMKASPIRIKTDNQGALSLIKNPVLTERSKHIDIQHHFVRERASRGEVAFEYCPTESMVADTLTKPLGEAKFVPFRRQMGVR
ncbi:hypothetical protein GPECTOR_411g255 [Gonium pectorale]|uniref:Uncharacterized protein n=1 Tax=Gonium pectorale TaxID=33097 RepID=A0A150FV84_GONPE|nr:hypothetical protein GPECTOR_411g255 [Gonium pectorale]|eukprot:KXZ41531.1 hypothetical protein GPECTOR_411g255 [Gonium pectorale]